jgi:hypothetical protein
MRKNSHRCVGLLIFCVQLFPPLTSFHRSPSLNPIGRSIKPNLQFLQPGHSNGSCVCHADEAYH